jgi:hypothetical protein
MHPQPLTKSLQAPDNNQKQPRLTFRSAPRATNSLLDKDKWIDRERLRWARKFNVPMHHAIPPGFPVNSLTVCPPHHPHSTPSKSPPSQVQRALTALSLAAPAQFPATVAALYAHYFVDHAPLARIEDFMPVFVRVAGAEVAATVEGMVSLFHSYLICLVWDEMNGG